MAQEIKMSAAGLKAMQEELEYLKTVRRKELAEEIKEARSHGDLSENSEYDEAKNTQGLVENRITELEQMIKNAVIIDESELSVDSVSVGTHVTIQMTGEDETEEYDIVGRTEADPLNGKISDDADLMHGILWRQACQATAVKSNAVQLVIHGIGTVRNIVCHKVNLFILRIHADQLLHDQLFLRCLKEISLTDTFVFCQTVPVEMGEAISLTLPEGIGSVTGDKIGKQIASVSIQQSEGAKIEKQIRCLTNHGAAASA